MVYEVEVGNEIWIRDQNQLRRRKITENPTEKTPTPIPVVGHF